jgi:hypothetical protein
MPILSASSELMTGIADLLIRLRLGLLKRL